MIIIIAIAFNGKRKNQHVELTTKIHTKTKPLQSGVKPQGRVRKSQNNTQKRILIPNKSTHFLKLTHNTFGF